MFVNFEWWKAWMDKPHQCFSRMGGPKNKTQLSSISFEEFPKDVNFGNLYISTLKILVDFRSCQSKPEKALREENPPPSFCKIFFFLSQISGKSHHTWFIILVSFLKNIRCVSLQVAVFPCYIQAHYIYLIVCLIHLNHLLRNPPAAGSQTTISCKIPPPMPPGTDSATETTVLVE